MSPKRLLSILAEERSDYLSYLEFSLFSTRVTPLAATGSWVDLGLSDAGNLCQKPLCLSRRPPACFSLQVTEKSSETSTSGMRWFRESVSYTLAALSRGIILHCVVWNAFMWEQRWQQAPFLPFMYFLFVLIDFIISWSFSFLSLYFFSSNGIIWKALFRFMQHMFFS